MAGASSAAPPRRWCVFGAQAMPGLVPVALPPGRAVSSGPSPVVPVVPAAVVPAPAPPADQASVGPVGPVMVGPAAAGAAVAGPVAAGAELGRWSGRARLRLVRVDPRIGLILYTVGQVALLAMLYVGYGLSRHLATGREPEALGNALDVWHLERFLHLPDEAVLQGAVLAHEWIPRGANWYYVGIHFPAAILLLVWVFARHREHWRRVRNVIILATGVGLVIHLLFPLAPPRFLPEMVPALRLVDTGAVLGPSPYSDATDGVANQYAAMPSLHVGWAVLEAWAVVTILRHRARWLALIQPLATVAVVVVTANHYWLDGIVGALLVAGAVILVGRRGPGTEAPAVVSRGFRAPTAQRAAARLVPLPADGSREPRGVVEPCSGGVPPA
ncbi:phosphatase PAP2 family protein [Frankia sp. Cpl3]|nr:phosphatase PAP2 family protein [Frankia sp. Cpl3]